VTKQTLQEKHTRELLKALRVTIAAMDAVGAADKALEPKRIAQFANSLELLADQLGRFGLDQSFQTMDRHKKQAAKKVATLLEYKASEVVQRVAYVGDKISARVLK